MSAFSKQIPENHRPSTRCEIIDSNFCQAFIDLRVGGDRLAQSRKITLHIRQEHRHSDPRESFRQHLQADRLTGTRRTRNQAMPVAVSRQKVLQTFAFTDQDWINRAHVAPIQIVIDQSLT